MEKTTLADQAYEALKEYISTLESGSHLSVRNFAVRIGLSYTPVREAFLRLEREGVLRQVPNVGFFVQEYDINAIISYYETRECVEPFVLERVFSQLTADDLQALQQHLDMCAQAVNQNDMNLFVIHDIEFHKVFFTRYGNPHLSNLYISIREQNRYCSKSSQVINSYAIDDHRLMLAAIQAGDRDEAIRLLKEHLSHARSQMLNGYYKLLR